MFSWLALGGTLTFALVGPAAADPIFSDINRINDTYFGGIFTAEMSLPAPVQAFGIYCVALGPIEPYRLEIVVDPEQSSYIEIDRSDKSEPDNPETWRGTIASALVGRYSPRIDGDYVYSIGILKLRLNGYLERRGDQWGYDRIGRSGTPFHYECSGDSRAGRLSRDLIHEMEFGTITPTPPLRASPPETSPLPRPTIL